MAAKPTRRRRVPTAKGKRAKPSPARSAVLRRTFSTPSAKQARKNNQFPIVGIGASAGGFESLMALLKHLPGDTGMAFVVVQHLDPKHTSKLSELLVRATPMRVYEIKDDMPIEPNAVFVIPPNYDVVLKGNRLQLKDRPESERVHMSIDHFFESLAEQQEHRAIGVVLSGTGKDGTEGLAAIKAAGGVTFAESEQSARYFAMPSSAISAGHVDSVLTPEELAAELPRIVGHPYLRQPRAVKPHARPFPEAADDFSKIFYLIKQQCGVDFSHYKHSTLQRRLARRMMLHQIDKLPKYIELLRANRDEVNALFNDILINVTSFFRDCAPFEILKKKVLPRLLKGKKGQGGEFRVWVPGCASGEEVYSVAICLAEVLSKTSSNLKVQIFGTDVSETLLSKARLGIYPEAIAKAVGPERLRRFFVKVASGYQIARSLREMCTFARQNIAEDPPFSHLDLISCRNVLIYLGPALQKKIMPIFHYALNSGGCLMLGTSETVGGYADLFTPLDKRHKIYLKKGATRGPALHFATRGIVFPHPEAAEQQAQTAATAPQRAPDVAFDLQRRVDQMVLSFFSPAGVLVDEELKVIQFRGQTGPFIEHASGAASLDLLQMVRPSLVVDLRTALHKAMKSNAHVRKEGAFVRFDGHAAPVVIHVLPLRLEPSDEKWYLVLFEQKAPMAEESPARAKAVKGKARVFVKEIESLRTELDSTRESLQAIIEEREATNEELKSANEEIQSANEELQSTNEELETAKEELQSANEELTTVNEELGTRNAELAQLNNDLNNLISSINIPIIIVDNALVVRRVTPLARHMFNLLPSDVGRQIGEIKPKLEIPDLEIIIRDVIDTLASREREVSDKKGHRFSLAVRPYRTTDNKIDGAVITLVDNEEISRLRKADQDRQQDEAQDAESAESGGASRGNQG